MTDKPTDPAFYMTRLDEALADTLRRMNERLRERDTKADSDGDDGA